jgi:hypothetical protein
MSSGIGATEGTLFGQEKNLHETDPQIYRSGVEAAVDSLTKRILDSG